MGDGGGIIRKPFSCSVGPCVMYPPFFHNRPKNLPPLLSPSSPLFVWAEDVACDGGITWQTTHLPLTHHSQSPPPPHFIEGESPERLNRSQAVCFAHFGQYVPFLLAPSSPLLVPLSYTSSLVCLHDPPYLCLFPYPLLPFVHARAVFFVREEGSPTTRVLCPPPPHATPTTT